MRNLVTLIALISLAATACGGATIPDDPAIGDQATSQPGDGSPGNAEPGGGGASSEPAPEPAGPVEPNTIRIGSQVWARTLPMTTGQCFLQADDGTLPDSGTVWGTLDGDETLRFSVSYGQDGTFESEISNNADMYWIAGSRAPLDDLVVELDFATQTISGGGTYTLLNTGETASGSFEFVCEG